MSMGAVSQVYWPSTLLQSSGGYVIGFNIHSFVVVVVAVLTKITRLSDATTIVSNLSHNPTIKTITEKYTQGSPIILGILRSTGHSSPLYKECDKQANLWLLFDQKSNGWPTLTSIHCFGISYHSSPQIVFYEPPSPRSHLVYSVDSLLVFPKDGEYLLVKNDAKFEDGDFELTLNQIQYSWAIEKGLALVVATPQNQIISFEDTSPRYGGRLVIGLIDFLMALIVFASPAIEFLQWVLQPGTPPSGPPERGNNTTKPPPTQQPHRTTKQSGNQPPPPQTKSHVTPSPLKWTWWDWVKRMGQMYRGLLSLSCFAHHAHSRLGLLLKWPALWKRGFTDVTWVHFYNQILLLFIDFFMGVFLTVFVIRNQAWLFRQSARAHNFIRYDFSQAYIEWLMGWPAGFKLNDELDLFLGNIFLLYIENWSIIWVYMALAYPYLISLISVMGLFGVSCIVAFFSDIVAFLNMHIYWLYTAIAKTCSIQLSALSSLWLLFRGKKRNVLKKRIDSCNYTIDQLLLGTLLFCVLVFLLPTMGTYYLFFFVGRFMILTVHWLVAVCLVFCGYFPIVPLVLFLGRSKVLSGGVRFELCPTGNSSTRNKISNNNEKPNSKFSGLLQGTTVDDVVQDTQESPETTVLESTYLYLKPNPKFTTGFLFKEMLGQLRRIRLSLQ